MTPEQVDALDWSKGGGLIPAVVQDAHSRKVLMLGYMNPDALRTTLERKRVTFFSRSKNRLWTKGETSGNFLSLVSVTADCDNDTLLIQARPDGPTCHTGTESCFDPPSSSVPSPAPQRRVGSGPSASEHSSLELATDASDLSFLSKLEAVIVQRITDRPEGSYTARIWSEGPTRIAQKVGEEGVEVALAAVTQAGDRLIAESADLLFHLALLLKSRNLSLADVVRELEQRHAAKP